MGIVVVAPVEKRRYVRDGVSLYLPREYAATLAGEYSRTHGRAVGDILQVNHTSTLRHPAVPGGEDDVRRSPFRKMAWQGCMLESILFQYMDDCAKEDSTPFITVYRGTFEHRDHGLRMDDPEKLLRLTRRLLNGRLVTLHEYAPLAPL